MTQQYIDLGNRIVNEGIWVENERTGKRCLTVINADISYDPKEFPLVTTRKSFWKAAVAELLGYIRGYSSAADFRALGTKTWDANANLNEEWLKNPFRQGEDDMGKAYRYRTNGYYMPATYNKVPLPVKQKLPTFKVVNSDLSQNKHGIVDTIFSSNSFGDFKVIKEYFLEGTKKAIFDIQFLNTGYIKKAVKKSEIMRGEVKDPYHPSVFGVACLGNLDGIPESHIKLLKPIWNNLIKRCYVNHPQHKWWYGKVFVEDSWLVFSNFAKDFTKLANWELKAVFPKEYSLDKDWCNANYYSKSTCRWSTKTEQSKNTVSTHNLKITLPNGEVYYFKGAKEFTKYFGLPSNVANTIGKMNLGDVITYAEHSIELLPSGYLTYVEVDQLKMVYAKLKLNIDDRRLIVDLHNPHLNEYTCLPACMYNHQFSLLGDKLYLNSTQRSCDVPLGLNFNMVQVYVFGALMAQITGHEFGGAFHKIVNAHVYEDQLSLFKEQLKRTPFGAPKIIINPEIKTLKDLETWVTVDDFKVVDYDFHGPINYPFSV